MLAQKVNGNIQAIVLAAGLGRRFGDEPKQLAMLRGKMLIAHVLEKIPQQLEPIIVTRRAIQAEIAHMAPDATILVNERPEIGLSESLKLGLQALKKNYHAMIFLADMPFVQENTIHQLLTKFDGTMALAPSFGGKRGHPVCLPSSMIAKAMKIVGDEGLGKLLGKEVHCSLLECQDRGILMDVDEKKDLTLQGSLG